MENNLKQRKIKRNRRSMRVRKHVRGNSVKPRLTVCRSNKHLSAQLIDDENHVTLAACSTLNQDLKEKKLKKSKEAARIIGQKIAEIAKAKQIDQAVFDRGWYRYHGLIAELANAAREAGLKF